MKLGVIVARFQTNQLTIGQALLINQALAENDKVLICLGCSGTKLTLQNPMVYEVREAMLRSTYHAYIESGKLFLHPLNDQKYDDVWSSHLDKIIEYHQPFTQAIIYGGRDSFKKHYSGKYPVKDVSFGIDHINTTEIRQLLHNRVKDCKDWREGIIYASANKYPVSYQAVDVAVLKDSPTHLKDTTALPYRYTGVEVLLARKPNEKLFRFPGGIVDPSDDTLETAAEREVSEECGPTIKTQNYNYIGSCRIDDWRYRHEPDKIMTAFFTCSYISGNPIPSDDLRGGELKWFYLSELLTEQIEPEHHVLLQSLRNYYRK